MGLFSKITGALETSLGIAKPEQQPQSPKQEASPQPQSKEQRMANLFLRPPSNYISLAEMGLKPADARVAKEIHWQITEQKVRQKFPEAAEQVLEYIKNTDQVKTIEAWANTPIPNYDALFNNLQLASPDALIKMATMAMAAQEAQNQQKEIADIRERLSQPPTKRRPTISEKELAEAQEFMQTVGQGEEVYAKQGFVTTGKMPEKTEPIEEYNAVRESVVGEGEFERARRDSESAVESAEAGGMFNLQELMRQEEEIRAKSKRG
ncbi:hypothetical protein KKG46_04975 [Patescibacteria group bacterium]|nr:hypothetical protein [Patescibacteria group bacterium]